MRKERLMKIGAGMAAPLLGLACWGAAVAQPVPGTPPPVVDARETVTRTPQTYYLFVLNEPKPDQVAEFNRWYDQQHAQDVLINPDYLESQRFIVDDRQLRPGSSPPARYLIAFKVVTRTPSRTFGYIHDNLRSGKTVSTESIAYDKGGGDFVYRAATPERAGRGAGKRAGPGFAGHYLQIEFSTAPPGGEAAYARWYDKVYGPKMAALPQVRRWRRFELSPVQLNPRKPAMVTPFMTMYELDIATPAEFDQVGESMRRIEREVGRPGVVQSSLTYRAIGPILLGSDVKRERAAAERSGDGMRR